MSTDNLFARRLNEVFDKIRRPDGSEYSNQDVADAIGGGTTPGHIWKLRSGQVQNPKFYMIKAIINFFGVEPAHFFVDDEQKTEALDPAVVHLAQQLDNDPDTRNIALRASQQLKSSTERKMVLGIIDAIEQVNREEAERLHPADPT